MIRFRSSYMLIGMNRGWNPNRFLFFDSLFLYLLTVLPGLAAARPDFDARGAEAIARFLNEEISRGEVPGVIVLITAPDRTLCHVACGKMNSAQGVEMRKDAIFRIASMTKALTSTAVMMLVEEKKLALEDELSKYLPAFRSPQVIRRLDLTAETWETRPATQPITIRQLLTHTSGIGYSWSDPGLAMIARRTKRTGEIDLPLLHEPGEKWTYGAGTNVLGNVVEKISGQPLDQFMENRIFRPLEMKDTAWTVPDTRRDRVVTLHQKRAGRLEEIPNPENISAQVRGDGRLFSTADDYSHFLQMILGRGQRGGVRLLQPATVAGMSRNQTGPIRVRLQPTANADYSQPFPLGVGEDVWGLGFQLASPSRPEPAMRRPGSMSWAGINNTYFWIDPREDLIVIFLTQFYPDGTFNFRNQLKAIIYSSIVD